jgi:phosphatidylserine/phosphatidylglycerophosphate/cardiolipin synthase-like enzyme
MNARLLPAEQRLIRTHRTPWAVQRWLNGLRYNRETNGETLRSFREVVRHGEAHCLEAALAAAVILEQHGYPPLLMGFESVDLLDHVIFVFRTRTGWGSVARSRDPGLHGRRPLFATPRALALSYVDPYVDYAGRVKGYAVVDLAILGRYDWRFSRNRMTKIEEMLRAFPHRPIRTSDERTARLRDWYRRYMEASDGRKPFEYRGRERWMPLPPEHRRRPSPFTPPR